MLPFSFAGIGNVLGIDGKGTAMTRPFYRIKLYGYAGEDKEWFVQKLAVLLKKDARETEGLIQEVPVVIKEGLEKQQAESLGEILSSIDALFLVEPVEGAESPSEPLPVPDEAEVSAEADRQDALRADVWMTIGVVTAGLLIVLSIVGYISTWKNFGARTANPEIRSPRNPSKPTVMDSKATEERIRTLRSEISAADKQAAIFSDELKLTVESVPPSADLAARRDRDKQLVATGRKLADVRLKALQLRKELRGLESK